MKNNEIDIAIIGGGASGLCAAIEAKRNNKKLKIVVFEKLARVGKKILATGNGRCNLSNINATENSYNNPEFCKKIFEKYSVKNTLKFFNSIGLYTTVDSEGRVYPVSNTASSVLDCLRLEAEKIGVVFYCENKIETVEKQNNYFIINKNFYAKKIIFATGGKASPAQGSDGSGYDLLKNFGIKIVKPVPALVPIKTDTKFTKQLKGIRCTAKLTLSSDNKIFAENNGEILFTDYGVSGIATMELGGIVARNEHKKLSLNIDLLPSFSYEKIYEIISKTNFENAENLLIGLLPKKLGQVVCKAAGINTLNQNTDKISQNDYKKIAAKIKSFTLEVKGTRDFEFAQITSGGADTKQFNEKTESKNIKGLFCVGEMLDIEGGCGGFNLQWAFASGLCAGYYASEDLKND